MTAPPAIVGTSRYTQHQSGAPSSGGGALAKKDQTTEVDTDTYPQHQLPHKNLHQLPSQQSQEKQGASESEQKKRVRAREFFF